MTRADGTFPEVHGLDELGLGHHIAVAAIGILGHLDFFAAIFTWCLLGDQSCRSSFEHILKDLQVKGLGVEDSHEVIDMYDEQAGKVAIYIQKVVAAAVKAVSMKLAFDQVSVNLLVPGARLHYSVHSNCL